jgi:hypothetical protein
MRGGEGGEGGEGKEKEEKGREDASIMVFARTNMIAVDCCLILD